MAEIAKWEISPMLTIVDVCEALKLSSRTIDRLVAVGRFPRPIKLGHSKRWRSKDVVRFIDAGTRVTCKSTE